MSAWYRLPFAAWDLETTGVDPLDARIVTSCLLHIDGAVVTRRDWLVDPGIEIPEAAAAIHGVTTEKARAEGMPSQVAVAEIADALVELWAAGTPVVIFNAAYDCTVLHHELIRTTGSGLTEGTCRPIVDPFVVDRHVDRYRRGKRTLGACCEHYGVQLDEAHAAYGDALMAARLAWLVSQRFPAEVGRLDPFELHANQAAWHYDWAVGFQQYLAKQGKSEVVDPSWPIRTHAAVAA